MCFAAGARADIVAAAVDSGDAAAQADGKPAPVQAAAVPMQTVRIKGSAASYDARRDDTASKIVVGSEEIQKYGDTSVNDVLKRLPGITVGGAAGRPGGEIRMRGLGGRIAAVGRRGHDVGPGAGGETQAKNGRSGLRQTELAGRHHKMAVGRRRESGHYALIRQKVSLIQDNMCPFSEIS